MTQSQTRRLHLPLLAAGQAQKEVAHNEALLLLDIICQAIARSADLSTPPTSPSEGDCWIVAAGAGGDWADRTGALAGWTAGGWRFAVPAVGWRAWVADRGHFMRFDGALWRDEAVRNAGYFVNDVQVVSARQAAIAAPAGGSTTDNEARASISAILLAMRAHGLIES